MIFCLSFTNSLTHKQEVAGYYDKQLDKLLGDLRQFQAISKGNANKEALTAAFFTCRNAYKKVEFLVDVFEPFRARLLNGPDLLKIEEENPGDSLKPHGFQVIEAVLYANAMDRQKLNKEIAVLIKNMERFRNDPDRIYYFRDDKIWQGARLGMYRIISMGITGFDVPQSFHALPETRVVLTAIHTVTGFYKKDIDTSLWKRGDTLFRNADEYLSKHNNFNTFDRMFFIREHVNKLSEWLMLCSKKLGVINYSELNPLNADAKNLFAQDIMNLAFFSPDKKYSITQDRVELGKRLFYDTRLSGDGSRSCASCHQAQKGFTDGLPKATNMSGNKLLLRNTPTLWNVALQTRQFYDSRTETLENQLSAVVHNTDEMNGSLESSVPRLTADKEYNAAFQKAYPEDKTPISHYNIANAISSYVRSLISLNSRFDQYMRHETDSFTADEKNGFNLFMGKAKCGTCHYAPVFNGLTPPLYQETESEILAVPATDQAKSILDEDPGKAKYTLVSLHKHAFKTSTVRNAALTAPYMHNGVFKTLDDVVSFYNDGGGAGRGITLNTQTLPADKLNLTKKEMKDIVAFLNTLTDTSGSSFAYYHIQ
ncbi:MAG: cytochrome-c peroxidase [Flavipsychrobacter sp.]|nr:cytochrome-c peroxidase [Flavipsychrobacter sp.]